MPTAEPQTAHAQTAHGSVAPNPVLITGASGGIGANLADFLLASGSRDLLFHYRSRDAAIRSVLAKHGVDPATALFRADLTDEVEVARLHAEIRERHGPLYGLVNLAGASTNAMSWKLTVAEFRSVLDANLMTTFLCCREFIPEMRARERGRILNISSVVGFRGAAGTAHYAAAKAGIVGLSRAMSVELAPKNVVVAAIALGYFQYGLIDAIPQKQRDQIRESIPSGRFGVIAELGGLAQYLLSESGAYASGQTFHLNGGLQA